MSAELMGLSGTDFLDVLASDAPAPGGGSTAALSGALGCALGEMVCGLTMGRKKYAAFEAEILAAKQALGALRLQLQAAVDSDAAAYDAVAEAYKLPKDDGGVRKAAIQRALIAAANSPLGVLKRIAAAADAMSALPGKSNANAASDLGAACAMLRAGADGALLNVLINVGGIEDEGVGVTLRREAEVVHECVVEACERVFSVVRDAMNP